METLNSDKNDHIKSYPMYNANILFIKFIKCCKMGKKGKKTRKLNSSTTKKTNIKLKST